MSSTFNKAIPCSVFGHNYMKSKTNADHTSELKCSHCNISVKTDTKGNFSESSISNKNIQSTLNNRISKPIIDS